MNARAVERRLMKTRTRVVWGPRAYLGVEVPMSIFPEPCPKFDAPEEFVKGSFAGNWERREGDELIDISIGPIFSGQDPQKTEHDYQIFFPECTGQWVDRGELHEDWTWWEGVHRTFQITMVEGKEKLELMEERDLPEVMVAAYRAQCQWEAKYIYHTKSFEGEKEDTLHCRLLWTGTWARATYAEILTDRVRVMWGVKWFYKDIRRRFCASLGNVLKQAKQEGVKVKLIS